MPLIKLTTSLSPPILSFPLFCSICLHSTYQLSSVISQVSSLGFPPLLHSSICVCMRMCDKETEYTRPDPLTWMQAEWSKRFCPGSLIIPSQWYKLKSESPSKTV